ncbi:MAG: CBS domain-containing protein [Deltaproteobacteria bacterium]|nr:CBS domain-containing protein [Deltaproteobacteria bacterium]
MDWQKILIKAQTSILEAMRIIDETSAQIAVVIDDNQRLLGTVTDGDIRRGILKGVSVQQAVSIVMNKDPKTASASENKDQILELMRKQSLNQLPLIDEDRHVIRVEFLSELLAPNTKDNWVVLMAGGKGSRLRPLTDDCPKPLLKVGGKPILETIINKFQNNGFHKFFLTVNYKAEMVKEYFGDGKKFGAEIRYVEEDEPLGTAGSLRLLPEKPELPLIVMNGDLLTTINFEQLLDFHLSNSALGTMCVREYDFKVPYGVVKLENHSIEGIDEKPIHKFFVNAGIYVLDPQALDFVPAEGLFDMPSLFEKITAQDKSKSVAFPIREYWLDIGQISDFKKANGDFRQVFPD